MHRFLRFRAFLVVLGLAAAGPAALHADQEHSLFSAILSDHVRDGQVDYAALKEDPRLDVYLEQLRQTTPASLNRDDALAYWINVYNAFTLKLIAENYPIASISRLHCLRSLYIGVAFGCTVWQTWQFPLHDGLYSLDRVEHEILRPQFGDFRIHAAIVCAARSCPPLREEAFRGAAVHRQLDDQMRRWLSRPDLNRWDNDGRSLHLSSIFNWFRGDFEAEGRNLLQAITPFFDEVTRRQISDGEVQIEFLDYDWSLNGVAAD